MKQNKKIPSYSLEELLPEGRIDLVFLAEEPLDSGIYRQIRVSEEQFKKITEILNIIKLGYQFNLYETKFTLEEYVDLSDD